MSHEPGTREKLAVLGSANPTDGDCPISQTFTGPANRGLLSSAYKVSCLDTARYGWAIMSRSLWDHESRKRGSHGISEARRLSHHCVEFPVWSRGSNWPRKELT